MGKVFKRRKIRDLKLAPILAIYVSGFRIDLLAIIDAVDGELKNLDVRPKWREERDDPRKTRFGRSVRIRIKIQNKTFIAFRRVSCKVHFTRSVICDKIQDEMLFIILYRII
jgi:hypothetical protein